jgi:adenylosuccinate synthase
MIEYVDICVGLAWGDEGKGKIVSQLTKHYDCVCRWNGGDNAGHTIYKDDKIYSTHLIPSGVFHGIKSIIGPGCVVNIKSFFNEINYLKDNGFNTDLIKISPKAHIVSDEHIYEDEEKYKNKIGTTARGIGPCYTDKYARKGNTVNDFKDELKDYIWDEVLEGKILCEGAQGFWLDIDHGNYPYVTSSNTLPYSACSLGFSHQKIRKIYGAVKIYDTRVGIDPEFSDELNNDKELMKIAEIGKEYGTTTGRLRKVNYLNVNKLIKALYYSGTTDLIISKIDILESINIFKYIYNDEICSFDSSQLMIESITKLIHDNNNYVSNILLSRSPKEI